MGGRGIGTGFNLIATSGRDVEFDAKLELQLLLSEVGDDSAKVWESGVSGLILANTRLEPREATRRLRDLLSERPFDFKLLRRIIPVEVWMETNLKKIEEACAKLSESIKTTETFRVTVEKRRSRLRSRELIEAAARHVDARVDLEKPDRIILIQVVGGETGVSLLGSEREILNVDKALLEKIDEESNPLSTTEGQLPSGSFPQDR
ncbi:MAG: THUMP domain-containing protein [Candidatus Geothermarchaeales archaeon]